MVFIDYSESDAAVTVNLSGVQDANGYLTLSGGYAEGDKIKNIEDITGSAYADTLTGDEKANLIRGGAGADTSLMAGDDRIGDRCSYDYGGDGWDYLSYSTSDAGVTIALDGTVGSGGDAAGDVLSNIENCMVQIMIDTLTGDMEIILIWGGEGADTLIGGAGNDYFLGDAGADRIDGGDGVDTINYVFNMCYFD